MHHQIEPGILYFGTPVVLISTANEDGSANLAPMSSAFCLGWRCMLGLAAASKTSENLQRTGEAVLNLPSDALVAAVDRLALTTGTDPVPEGKLRRGYRHERDKFALAGLTPVASRMVAVPGVLECPLRLEARLEAVHPISEDDALMRGHLLCFEMRVQRVHAAPEVLMDGHADRIDPDRWRPLIMSFQQFYGLGAQLQGSKLASIPEALYRSPDLERARRIAEISSSGIEGSP
jgi:flavin reductase (DIM6/NTAB) family NADH-FMN oxidoreductase RutF